MSIIDYSPPLPSPPSHAPNILLLLLPFSSADQVWTILSYDDSKSPPSAVGKNPGNWTSPSTATIWHKLLTTFDRSELNFLILWRK